MSVHLKHIVLRAEKFPTDTHYPFSLPIFHDLPPLNLDSPITCFVGENGSGKSTLLEAVARACGISRARWRTCCTNMSALGGLTDPFQDHFSVRMSFGILPRLWMRGRQQTRDN